MASVVKLTVTLNNESTTEVKNYLKYNMKDKLVNGPLIQNLIDKMLIGNKPGKIDLQVDDGNAVASSGTVTFSGTGAANDTLIINGVTFTAKASGATGNEWNVGASATLSAQAFKAAVNASASALVSGLVTASGAGAVITLTANTKGTHGNAYTFAEGVDGSSHMAVSAARLTGGVNATANEIKFSIP
jgi:phage tail sheath gpL-like